MGLLPPKNRTIVKNYAIRLLVLIEIPNHDVKGNKRSAGQFATIRDRQQSMSNPRPITGDGRTKITLNLHYPGVVILPEHDHVYVGISTTESDVTSLHRHLVCCQLSFRLQGNGVTHRCLRFAARLRFLLLHTEIRHLGTGICFVMKKL